MAISTSIQAQTYYRISFPNPNGHLFRVEVRFEGKLAAREEVRFPVWTPGSYLVRDYAKNIESISALDAEGKHLPLTRNGKAAWWAECGGKPFTVQYNFYGNELTIRHAHLDATHAFFTPAALLVYSPTLMNQPHTVEFPSLLPGWGTVSVALPQAAGKPAGRAFTATSYDELADSPFEIGSHQEQTFDVDGCRYRLATYSMGNAKLFTEGQLIKMKDIVHQANQVFGGTPPIKEYLFINLLAPGLGGGLEHMASTVLGAPANLIEDEKALDNHYSLVAHEYFHIWNVKRIRPERLGPFDYQNENHSTMLWFAEGFTGYYDDLLTARAKVYSPERYFQALGSNLSATRNTYANRVQSLSDASYLAWIQYYKPNENRDNATISYYIQGGMFAFATDLKLRILTKGKKSLDDLMRLLWQRSQNGADKNFYVNPQTFTAALTEVAGQDMSAWVKQYTETPSIPDFEGLMKEAGIQFENRYTANTPFLGINTQRQADRYIVSSVRRDSPAERAGISFGDLIQTVNGKGLTEPLNLETLGLKVNDVVAMELAHMGRPYTVQVKLEPTPYVGYNLSLPKKTPAVLKGWMEGSSK